MFSLLAVHRCRVARNAGLALAALWFVPFSSADAAAVRLATDRLAGFDIVVADDTERDVSPPPKKPLAIEFGNPRTSVWETAHLRADYLHASTGATFAVRNESDPATQPGSLHVGPTRFAVAHLTDDPRAADLDDDGFIHDIIDDQHIVILGGSDLGTEFGVYDFLERHAGVRWLLPRRGRHPRPNT